MAKARKGSATNSFLKLYDLEDSVKTVALLMRLLTSAHTLSPESTRLLERTLETLTACVQSVISDSPDGPESSPTSLQSELVAILMSNLSSKQKL